MKNILFTAIIFFGTFSLDFVKRSQKILIASGTVTIFLNWIDRFFSNPVFNHYNQFNQRVSAYRNIRSGAPGHGGNTAKISLSSGYRGD
jgi:hypothetical protein